MTRSLIAAVGAGLVALSGCNQGTSTAPPTAPGQPAGAARKLTVRALYEHKAHRDGTDELTVGVDRDNFTGPITIELRDLPAGVSLATTDMSIPAGKDSLTVTVKATPDAPLVDDHVVRVAAKAADMPEASTTFKLDVLPKS